MSPFRLIAALILFIAAGFLIHSNVQEALLGYPAQSPPLTGVDLHQIQGPWFEVARLDADLEREINNPALFVRFAGKGENGLYPYADPENPRFRLLLFGYDSKGSRKTVLDTLTDPIMDYARGTVSLPCALYFHCGYHLIAMDETDRIWMIVAGHNKDRVWVFSRGPGLHPKALAAVIGRLQDLGFATDKLTYSNQLPAIPEILPAAPSIMPPAPKLPVPPGSQP